MIPRSLLHPPNRPPRLVLLVNAVLLLVGGTTSAQVSLFESRSEPQQGTLPPTQGLAIRPGLSLNGPWNVIYDPTGRGDGVDFNGVEIPGYWKHQKNESGLELVEYSFSPSAQFRVPGDWNTQDPRLFFYRKTVWYQRTFESEALDEALGKDTIGQRSLLHFGAVNYRADVWLNGNFLGFHTGGFTPFAFDATAALTSGTNELIVRVSADTGEKTVPTANTDWLEYGGITRDVRLVRVPDIFLRDWSLRLDRLPTDTAPARLVGWTQAGRIGSDTDPATDPPSQGTASISVPELGLEATVPIDASGRADFAFDVPDLGLWSPDRPKLYDVMFRVGTDQVTDRIGFRSIATEGHQILLNGEPIRLRGISAHEESLLHPGRSHGVADAVATLDLVQELGANFVRLAHYPHDEATTRLADERGLLVWAEIPVYWSIAFDDEDTLAAAQSQLEELIVRDRNRASLVFWSIANETPQTPERLDFLRQLAAAARRHDPSRLLTAALLGDARKVIEQIVGDLVANRTATSDAEIELVIEDPLADVVDVLGYNEYLGWYYAAFVAHLTPFDEPTLRRAILDRIPRIRIRSEANKPILISEFGAGAKAGHHHPEQTPPGALPEIWTEEYQALVYRRQLAMLAASPQVQGWSPWILKDFRTALRPLHGVQDWWNRKGLVDETGRKKLAFEVLRAHYRQSQP